MALLTLEKRKAYFKELGLEYNEATIKALQRKYMARKSDADGIYGKDTDNMLRSVVNTLRYTKNFDPKEFRCECGGKYCCGFPSYMKKVELENLQKIRTHFGKPMIVTSGLRCSTWNQKQGGSIVNSKHLSGYACDFNIAGVTESTAQRKAAIKWIKKLPNHNYTYGHGYNSNGVAISAPYMGTGKGAALHTDTNKPVATTATKTPVLATVAAAAPAKKLSSREKIAKCAYDFAYIGNSKKARYPGGKPKAAYKKALYKAYPNLKKMSSAAAKGASCDVFVGTCVRAAGVDKNFPRGLSPSYLAKSKKFKRINKKNAKSGDIIVTPKHICIVYNGKIKEASHKDFYPKTTNTLKKRLKASGAKVYRAK